jgi:hypothetical protein
MRYLTPPPLVGRLSFIRSVAPGSSLRTTFKVSVQVGPPGGVGWVYVVTLDGEAASIVDAQSPWIS